MKALELTLTLKNNLLKARRLALGKTPGEMAEAIGISYPAYLEFEALTRSPIHRRTGEWTKAAQAVAEYHGLGPEELWPRDVLKVKQRKVVATMDAETLAVFEAFEASRDLPPAPTAALIEEDRRRVLGAALAQLRPVERKVIERRFGLDGNEPETLDAIARKASTNFRSGRQMKGVTKETIRHRESKAIQEIRSALRRQGIGLDDLVGPE